MGARMVEMVARRSSISGRDRTTDTRIDRQADMATVRQTGRGYWFETLEAGRFQSGQSGKVKFNL